MWPTAPPAKRGRPGTGTGRYAASRRRSASNGASTIWRSGGRAGGRRLAACAPRPARCAPRASFRGHEGVLDALVLAQAVHHLARLLGGVEAPHLDAVHGVAIAHHAHQGGLVAPAAELLHEA